MDVSLLPARKNIMMPEDTFDHWQSIKENQEELRDTLDSDSDKLLEALGEEGILTYREEKNIQGIKDSKKRINEVLAALCAKNPNRFYHCFVDVLHQIGRMDVLDLVKGMLSYPEVIHIDSVFLNPDKSIV